MPRAGHVLPVVPLAVAFASMARAAGRDPLVDTTTFLFITTMSAALIGLPVAFWLLDHRIQRRLAYVAAGAVAAAVPFALMLGSAALGVGAQLGVDSLRWMLARRAVVPVYGSMLWSRFFAATAEAVVCGGATALTFWSLRSDPKRSFARSLVSIVVLIAVTVTAARLVGALVG